MHFTKLCSYRDAPPIRNFVLDIVQIIIRI